MAKKKKGPEPEPEEFHWDESVANFITIRRDENDEIELDLGSVNAWEAVTLLKACWEEMESRTPEIQVRFRGNVLD